ncbi:hypothetical protein MRX96_025819 [Rhipicephalus microplus]
MGHPNPLDFFATLFSVLPWILTLLQNFYQPTGSPLSCGACHLPVNASPRPDGLCQPGLYSALECSSLPTLSLRWPRGHQLAFWSSGTLSSDSATVPWSTNINPRQTLTVPSGLNGTPAMSHPNPLDFFARPLLGTGMRITANTITTVASWSSAGISHFGHAVF